MPNGMKTLSPYDDPGSQYNLYQATQPAGQGGSELGQLQAVKDFTVGPSDFGGTMAGASTGNPYMAAAGLGLDVAGLGLKAYGSYQAREAAEKAAEKSEQRYQQELSRMRDLDAERKEQQRLANQLAWGQYAGEMEKSGAALYGG